MKKVLFGIVGFSAVMFGWGRPAEASLFIRLTDGFSTVSCNNDTAAGVTACGAAGFSTSLGSNSIKTTAATQTVGDYTLSVDLLSNVPGNSNIGFVIDSLTGVTRNQLTGGHGNLVVDTAGFNFNLPGGPQLFMSASQTSNWTTSVNTDSSGFQVWGRNDNLPTIPGGDATALSPVCTSPGGLTQSCSASTIDVPFLRTTSLYALTSRAVIQQAVGSVASYTGTSAVLAQPLGVPEPASMLLFGTGLVLLAAKGRRRLQNKKNS